MNLQTETKKAERLLVIPVCGCQGSRGAESAEAQPEILPVAMAKGITCTHPEHRS